MKALICTFLLLALSSPVQSSSSEPSRKAAATSFKRSMDVRSPAFDPILSRMTIEEKVGMLLMTRLSATTVEPFLQDFHTGSFLVWGEVDGVKGVADFCTLANRAQELSLRYRRLPVWLHGLTPGLGWSANWISNAAKVFNLAPVGFLDGGRIVTALSP